MGIEQMTEAAIQTLSGEHELAQIDSTFSVEMGEYYYATSSECSSSKSCGTGTCAY